MESLSVQQRLRPIRYAFMVCANDMNASLTAVSINSVLWGGIYNPIISIDPSESMLGLLKTFDPDFLVDLTGGSLPDPLPTDFQDRILSNEDLIVEDQPSRRRRINLGFGIEPILRHIHENELGGGTKSSRATIIKDVQSAWIPYTSFVFGGYSLLPTTDIDFAAAYRELAAATDVVFDPEKDLKHCENLYPIDATACYIRRMGGYASFSSHLAYYERRLKNVAQGGRKTWRLISESSVTGSPFEDQV